MSTVATSEKMVQAFVDPQVEELPAVQPGIDVCGVRAADVWGKFRTHGGKPTIHRFDHFRCGVMLNVRFESLYQPKGCGDGEYTGHAIGDLLEGIDPNPRKFRHARALRFANCSGSFTDGATGKVLRRCTALFLLPGLKARYIP